jgi:hypothetical protein
MRSQALMVSKLSFRLNFTTEAPVVAPHTEQAALVFQVTVATASLEAVVEEAVAGQPELLEITVTVATVSSSSTNGN